MLRSISFVITPPAVSDSMNSEVTSSNQEKVSASSRLMDLFPLRKKLLDHNLLDETSRETTNVDDIMHIALVDAAVAEAPFNGSLGSAEAMHVQRFEKRKICHQTENRSRKKSTLGSFTLRSKTAFGQPNRHLRRALSDASGSLHGCSKKRRDGSVGSLPSH